MTAGVTLLLLLIPPPDGQRPREPWVFRSVLDQKPRIVTIALHRDLWVAYDATFCGLYKAWAGGVKFTGTVYDTVHGPQPQTQGPEHVVNKAESPWLLRDGSNWVRVTPRYRGHRIQDGHVTLHFSVRTKDGRELDVFETPEYEAGPGGKPTLVRAVRAAGFKPGDELMLTVFDGHMPSPWKHAGAGKWEYSGPTETAATEIHSLVFTADGEATLRAEFEKPDPASMPSDQPKDKTTGDR